jgi:formylmethanofuran dehydrogenase subunit E
MSSLEQLLQASAARHHHLCPRQVLGVRIGIAGANILSLNVPRSDKRLLVIVETDGCFVSGIEVVTGCSMVHRTVRVEDYGKVAATFVDATTGQAFRLAPKLGIRQKAFLYADGETRRYQVQIKGYAAMPETELLAIQTVHLKANIPDLIGRPGVRVICYGCGEEIMNDRQVATPQGSLCKVCAGESYYNADPIPAEVWHQN